MLDVGAKITTLREARAEGFIRLAPSTLARLKAGETPKPDVLATARAAALLAAKKTPELIPHCHPIPLEALSVDLVAEAKGVRVTATAAAIARTGVEMEALCAVQVACLVLYDMLKALDQAMVIEGVRLLDKSGGKDDFAPHLKPGYKAAVLVASDRVSQGQAEDKTGPWLLGRLKELGVQEPSYHLLPDDEEKIRALFLDLHAQGTDLVISTGGTGLSPRDRTVEALRPILDRELPGAMEASRAYGQARTPYAMLSRGLAGHRGKTLYVTLPGSSGGVRDSFTALFPALFHASHVLAQGSPAHAAPPAPDSGARP
ncbi:MAG TPA: bifunctional molybdenum cofactor biosynthesis protein MoaC/MoaB [bacterium]|nr:bifunctional molybdenum cofactor biosynthesis protein MoaC/MoaB [bacterium]